MTDTAITMENISKNGAKTQAQGNNGGRTKARRELPTLVAHGVQERRSLKLQGSVAPNAREVSKKDFPLLTPFVNSPDSNELFIKLDKHTIVSLFSQQKYASVGVAGYLVNLA